MATKTVLPQYSDAIFQMYAKEIELQLNPPIMLRIVPRAKKLTKKQLFWLKWHPKRVHMRWGQALTRKLMKRFEIYEDEGYGY